MAALNKSHSRLDRLFILLENGSTPTARKAAAKQLGEVQKKYPHELNNLLARLLNYIQHKEWDTRLAGSEAIKAVVMEVPLWSPSPEVQAGSIGQSKVVDGLKFSQINISQILSETNLLLSSSGAEFDSPEDDGIDDKEKVLHARRRLEKSLGLTVGTATPLGVSSQDLFGDEDLITSTQEHEEMTLLNPASSVDAGGKKPSFDEVAEGMSNRERNRAKRKDKILLKQNSRDASQEGDGQPPEKKKKSEIILEDNKEENSHIKRAPKHEPSPENWKDWPFCWICEELLSLLFSYVWEWRHGACLALRDILSIHGTGAGVHRRNSAVEIEMNNQAWLEDAAVRLLCVMLLDRFCDFVSDRVVAPVRESCAQTLGVVAKYLKGSAVSDLIDVLVHLTQTEEWEVRHAGFLGIKYVLAVRTDLHEDILGLCLPSLLNGLCDQDCDVKGVSADALVLVTGHLVSEKRMHDSLRPLLKVLCDSLSILDELIASTQSVLTLISKIAASLSPEELRSYMNVNDTLTYLWPFLQHSMPAIREAALLTIDVLLCTVTSLEENQFETLAKNGFWSLFQCCILEAHSEIQETAVKVWDHLAACLTPIVLCQLCHQYFPVLLSITSQPENVPYPPGVFVHTNLHMDVKAGDILDGSLKYIGGSPSHHKDQEFANQETISEIVLRTRQNASRMIGVLCKHVCRRQSNAVAETMQEVSHHLICSISSRCALHRVVGCMTLSNCWKLKVCDFSQELYPCVLRTLTEDIYYNELSPLFMSIQSEIKSLFMLAMTHLHDPKPFNLKQVYSIEDAISLCAELKPRITDASSSELADCHQHLCHISEEAQHKHLTLQRSVRIYLAHALVTASYEASTSCGSSSVSQLPKLNPVIRPLMEGLKKENNRAIRKLISEALTHLMDICLRRDPCPNAKLLNNLCSLLQADKVSCPDLLAPAGDLPDILLEQFQCSKDSVVCCSIITLLRRHAVLLTQKSERKKKKNTQLPDAGDELKEKYMTARAGALACISYMCEHFKEKLFHSLPQLWSTIANPHLPNNSADSVVAMNGSTEGLESADIEKMNSKILSLLVLEAITQTVNEEIARQKILILLPQIFNLVWNCFSTMRFVTSHCLAALTKRFPTEVMTLFVEQFLPSIDAHDNLYKRMGTVELIATIIDSVKTLILPYTVLLVLPLLGRMSDQNTQVRITATQCFASLIQYLPVESSIPDPPNVPPSLIKKKQQDRIFLEQLLDTSSLKQYPIPVPINAKLRKYQEDGVKWMAFLNRYKLHGVLCDDMGLGKTLQSICMLASDHFHKKKMQKAVEGEHTSPAPSLVISPPTLTGHWMDEIQKFCQTEYLNPIHYAGQPTERVKLQSQLDLHNLVIASYEVVRNDVEFFRGVNWNYCILDEGHMIRNGKSKLTMCVKSIKSNHRLILTGTPIQNSVLELWSLFDFLMPGFLGSEQEFNSRYSKPILASRDAKSTSKEQEEGVMAMEALHRQVLPFMLRRMKQDVLQDLPPKIIQDYYCNLSPLQVRLYGDFSKTRAKKEVDMSITQVEADRSQTARAKQTSHVFQALQYLQKVCNHPALVLTQCHPEYQHVSEELADEKSSLHDIHHSCKLVALKQLLLDCGIGALSDTCIDNVVSQHRALIFCQHKSMLDIVEQDLLRKHMTSVTFLRLDGSVAAKGRHAIVSKFNDDPSIDLLLLTTKVGGLGLNLAGADTVIFIEHDWNPTVDLQAMDRAHRIGQKRVVNVYRLITRGTLEEKILGLQRFKLSIANTVISADNSSVRSMDTSQLLDLFVMNKSAEKEKNNGSGKSLRKGLRALMDDIGELWDQNQYDAEYNLDNFMEHLVS